MKKYLTAMLLTGFVLTACHGEAPAAQKAETIPVAQTSSVTETGQAEAWVKPLTISFISDHMDGYDAETGKKKLLDFKYQWLDLQDPAHPQAAGKIYAALEGETNRFCEGSGREDQAPLGADAALNYAREGYKNLGADFTAYAMERTYHPHQQGRLLTIGIHDYAYLGGAHGSQGFTWLVFDRETGEKLSLEDLTEDPEGLRGCLLNKMVDQANSNSAISDAINWFEPGEYEEGLAPLLRDGTWRFEGENFLITSQEYELGSYAAGPVEFKIPAAEIANYLKPQYLQDSLQPGSLSLKEPGDLPLIGNITRAPFSETLHLAAEGCVYDVCLQELEVYEDGVTFRPGEPLLYCGEMKDCALCLSVTIPELIPDLMVTYRTADGIVHKQALTQSGEDGHYFLMDIDIP